MAQSRFPFQRLPYDLRSEVLKTMDLHEIIIYSLVSKMACSIVKALRLPLSSVKIIMMSRPVVVFQFGSISINVEFGLLKKVKPVTRLENVYCFYVNISTKDETTYRSKDLALFWPNQELTLGQWIKRLCSISHNDTHYSVEFHIGKTDFEIETLHNIFPRIRNIEINYFEHRRYHNRHRLDLPNEKDILLFQKVVRAFLPSVEKLSLNCGPLLEHFSIQHIGMTNLNELKMYSPRNLSVEDLLTFNVKKCLIFTKKISLRDWNRFFKLWIKGSNPRLEHLIIERNGIPEWNVLLKGLKAEETEGEGSMKFIVRNSRGVCAKIGCKLLYGDIFHVEFTVSK